MNIEYCTHKFPDNKGTIKTRNRNRSGVRLQAFQFHKGTIKTETERDYTTTDDVFQFHKGTIKTYTDYQLRSYFKDFNSIKVRLKQGAQQLGSAISKFQFHKGTIKTGGSTPGSRGRTQFQFHKGTIKTQNTNFCC